MAKANRPERRKKERVRPRAIRRLGPEYNAEQQLIWRIYHASNRRLTRLLSHTKVDVRRLTEVQKEMVEDIAKGGRDPLFANLHLWSVFSKVSAADRLRARIKIKSFQEIYEGAFAGAVLEIGKGRYDHALRFLEDISHDWLTSPRGLNSGPVGRKAFALRKAIASAWVSAHAAEYARLNVKETRFKEPGEYGRVLWSGAAVEKLTEVGDLNDVAALRQIGRSCGEGHMEGLCSYAIGRIITRTALQASLESGQKEMARLGIRTRLNKQQLAYRFDILFQRTGLSSAVRALPNLRELGGYFDPVSSAIQIKDLEKLVRNKLDGKISFGRQYSGIIGGLGWKELEACKRFLLRQGMARPAIKGKKIEEVVLTEKGKAIISALCKEIGGISIRRT